MSDLVPLGDELVDGALEGGEVGEIGRPEALASEDAEPLLDRVHPGAVDRGDVGTETRMVVQPAPYERAVMDRDVVGEQVDGGDRGGDGPGGGVQEGQGIGLAVASGGDPGRAAGGGGEGGGKG